MIFSLQSLPISRVSRPVLPDIGIVAFVPEEWGGLWMPRHQVLSRLSRYFHVVWAEPPHSWRESWLTRGAEADTFHEPDLSASGFVRYRPGIWLPQVYRPKAVGAWLESQRVKRAAALLRRRGCKTTVFYLWRPGFAHVLDAASYNLSCYHIDDEYSFSALEHPLDEAEVQLIKRVDQVFIHSPALLERKGGFNPNTLYVPNGVDYAAFSSPHDEPADLKAVPHPRLGYIGNIKTQLDFQVLYDLATRHPEWSLVLVGPRGYLGADADLVKKISALRNVYLLGNKLVAAVCAYPQHMDVCLLPYAMNNYTKYIYPLKLHEYLASGRPVVATPIRSLESFGHVVALARNLSEWEESIRAALSPTATQVDSVEERRKVAQKYEWDGLVKRIAQTICERLGQAKAA